MRYARLSFAIAAAALLVVSGSAIAQTQQDDPGTESQTMEPSQSQNGKMMLTEEEASSWVSKPVYSSDGKEIGEVAAFTREADNTVIEMHADIGGMMGMGETRVKLTPEQFKMQEDRVVLNMTEAEAKNLPKIED